MVFDKSLVDCSDIYLRFSIYEEQYLNNSPSTASTTPKNCE